MFHSFHCNCLLAGGPGVRACGDISAGATHEGRSQRTGHLLHHPLHRHLLQSGPAHSFLRRSSAGVLGFL
ncbi:UNVERIFIED_CONTAM: hypothetical protein NCL1_36552 [Trichonephila clavipes]